MQKKHIKVILSFFYLLISQKSLNFALVIELERHIQILLLSNDCVIVPELGGFMAYHVDAHYDEEEHTFFPPLRTLGFNPKLKINDSLLALSYVEAYDISYPDAIQRVEDEVNELKMHIQTEGAYDLYDIGRLALNDEGNYVFTPCESGILTPALYGLDTFDMSPLQPVAAPRLTSSKPKASLEAEPAATIPISTVSDEKDDEDDDDTIRISFSWIRNTVAIATILLAIFLITLPTGKTDIMTRTISNFNNGLLFGMMSKDTNMSEIKIKKEDTTTKTTITDTILKKDTTKTIQTAHKDVVRSGYCIVLASQVSKQNAEMFVEILKKKGLDSAEVYVHNNVRRIICGNFQTPSEAYQALSKINKNEGLEDAWVYKFN